MTISSGTRLGPYEVLSPLGAGGMGEVYRARDTKLDRDVAVKVLPADLADDPEALSRLEREARAVAQLSHPNILAIHDFGREGEVAYAIMELLEGETLRARLEHGALPARKAVDLAVQMAEGLAAAHEKGIVHRDLKPENVFVTGEGRVKLLDFGLAKRTDPATGSGSGLLTAEKYTEPGTVMGTFRYMSPEQVRGEAVDHRSDIFSYGVVLYEMLAGRQAFGRETAAESMTAILKEDPPEIAASGSGPSPALQRIVQHCLEKKPGERFQSARDIAFALQALSGSTVTSERTAAVTRRRWRPWLVFGSAVAIAVTLSAVWLIARSSRRSGVLKVTRLTFRRGQVDAARFAPDGQTIVYSASWNGSPYEVFSTRLDSTESRALGFSAAVLAGISASGEMALLRNAIPSSSVVPSAQVGMLASAPLAGGAARDLAEGILFADWSPDGKQLAVVRVADGKTRLEFPIGRVLYETGGWIANPRVSPRGDRIAFLDFPSSQGPESAVVVVDLSGQRTVLATPFAYINGLAWSRKGDEVWFAGGRTGLAKDLHAVTLSGRERVVFRTLTAIHLYDVGADGRVLLAQEQRRRELWGRAAGALEDRDLSWMDNTALIKLSSDGKTLVFNEYGEGGGTEHGVYLRAMDGSAPVRIGGGAAFDMSADGKWVLTIAQVATPRQQIVLLPTGAGQPRELPTESLTYDVGIFSPDGRKIVFGASKPGEALRMYVQDVDGATPQRPFGQGVAPSGWDGAGVMSAKSQFVVRDPAGRPFVQSLVGGDPRPIQGISPDESCTGWSVDGRLYVSQKAGMRIRVFRVDPATGRREVWKEIGPADTTGVWPSDGLFVTPDGSAYVYTFARRLSDLYLVEGLE
jgi:serine/threonine protein kinase